MEKLYMPTNISTSREVFEGFSKKETKAFMFISILNLILAITICIYFKTFQSFVLTFLIASVFNYFICKKDTNGYSTGVYIGYFIKYFTKQQKFYYKYTGWWEQYEKEE